MFTLILLAIISSPMVFGRSVSKKSAQKYNLSVLKNMNLKRLRHRDVSKIRKEFIWFYKEIDKITKHEQKQTVFLQQLERFLNSGLAYASDSYSNECLFGGWPSVMERGVCRHPWTKQRIVSYMGESYRTCDGGAFLCNPLLFGKNKCVDIVNNNFVGLTSKCDALFDPKKEEDKKELLAIEAKLRANNAKKLNAVAKDIGKFCHHVRFSGKYKPSSDHFATCKGLDDRLARFGIGLKQRIEEADNAAAKLGNALNENKAMSILKHCQDKFEEGKNFLSSDRDIFNHILAVGVDCERDKMVTLDKNTDLAGLDNKFSDFAEDVLATEKEEQMLDELNKDAMVDNFYAFMKQKATFEDDELLKDDNKWNKAVAEFEKKYPMPAMKNKKDIINRVRGRLKANSLAKNYSARDAKRKFWGLAKALNKACQATRKSVLASPVKRKKKRGHRSSDPAYKNMLKEHVHGENGKNGGLISEFKGIIDNFVAEDPGLATLFIADNMKDVFTGLDRKAALCASGKNPIVTNANDADSIVAIDLEDITTEDIKEDIDEVNESLADDAKQTQKFMKHVEDGDKNKIKDDIREILKSKPHMLAGFLNTLDSAEDKSYFAKYVCKATFEIYRNDTIREVGLTAASFVVGFGVGGVATKFAQVAASRLLFTAAASVIDSGVTYAVQRSVAEEIRHGADVGLATERLKLREYNKREKIADNHDNPVLYGAAAVATVAGSKLGQAIKFGKKVATKSVTPTRSALVAAKVERSKALIHQPLSQKHLVKHNPLPVVKSSDKVVAAGKASKPEFIPQPVLKQLPNDKMRITAGKQPKLLPSKDEVVKPKSLTLVKSSDKVVATSKQPKLLLSKDQLVKPKSLTLVKSSDKVVAAGKASKPEFIPQPVLKQLPNDKIKIAASKQPKLLPKPGLALSGKSSAATATVKSSTKLSSTGAITPIPKVRMAELKQPENLAFIKQMTKYMQRQGHLGVKAELTDAQKRALVAALKIGKKQGRSSLTAADIKAKRLALKGYKGKSTKNRRGPRKAFHKDLFPEDAIDFVLKMANQK